MAISDLLKLDVSKFIEKKNNLSYLSWAHAWAEALKVDPAATFHVESFQEADGTTVPYMGINGTAMVWVRVRIFEKDMTCFLPVMDHRNKPIPKPDAFQVNTAIMRCMTKCLALHGLGLHIYAGEDLPMVESDDPKEEKKEEKKGQKGEENPKDEQQRANAELFAEAAIEYLGLCKSLENLRNYWEVNQAQIDTLKSNYPDLFKRVRDAFSALKADFLKKEKEDGSKEST